MVNFLQTPNADAGGANSDVKLDGIDLISTSETTTGTSTKLAPNGLVIAYNIDFSRRMAGEGEMALIHRFSYSTEALRDTDKTAIEGLLAAALADLYVTLP